jgi:hypothetical protein
VKTFPEVIGWIGEMMSFLGGHVTRTIAMLKDWMMTLEETRDPLDSTKNDLKLWGQARFDEGVDTYHQVRKLDGL